MAFPGMNTKSGANTYRQGLVVPTRASEADFMKGYSSIGKSYATSPGYIQQPKQGLVAQPTTTSMLGLTGFKDMNPYAQNDALYKIGLQDSYTPEQLAQLEGLDTSGLANKPGMFDGMTAGGVAQGIGAAANLANAYLGYKNYGLAKDKFAFEKAATNRSIANQASEYNTGIQNAGEVGMSLAGGTMDPNARAARQAQLEGQKISGLAIG